MPRRSGLLVGTALVGVGVATGAWLAAPEHSLETLRQIVEPLTTAGPAHAQEAETVSPIEAQQPRDTYYPNTEDLAPDEMRVIACGTGMPTTRAAQTAACSLVELGNGDKFLFDIGSGSAERISSLQIPYNFLEYGLTR